MDKRLLYMENFKNDKLYLHFLSEEYFLEHWTIQSLLRSEESTHTYQKMAKRLEWVKKQILKIEETK
jgi:hypothetical protein